jgi:GTP-binding protein Era
MERLFDARVYLKLWVKVREGWSDDARMLQALGYTQHQ